MGKKTDTSNGLYNYQMGRYGTRGQVCLELAT